MKDYGYERIKHAHAAKRDRGRRRRGLPTYAKLNENAETIILNCAECEPLLRLHRQLLEKYAQEIVDTFHLIGEAVGAKEVDHRNQESIYQDDRSIKFGHRRLSGGPVRVAG